MNRYLDTGSWIVAFLTLVLFVAALFVKGISHDLFLEAGVFLVSVKIIVMSYRNSMEIRQLGEKLDRIQGMLDKKSNSGA